MVKAAKFQEEKEKEDLNITKLTFSQGWLEKVMNRNGLSVRCRTTEAQKSPDQLINKLCAYMLQVILILRLIRFQTRSVCFNLGQFGAGTKHRSQVIVLPSQKQP